MANQRQRDAAKRKAAEAAGQHQAADMAEVRKQRKLAKTAAAEIVAAAQAEREADWFEPADNATDAIPKERGGRKKSKTLEGVEEVAQALDTSPQFGAKGKGKGKRKSDEGIGKEFEVFVRGLPFAASHDVLWKDFEECGPITNLHLPLNEEGNARGIAFIQYTNQTSVDSALKFHDTEYGGRWIQVRLSSDDSVGKGKSKDGKSQNKDGGGKDGKKKGGKCSELEIFVGGLPCSSKEEALRGHFDKCGKIVYCRVPVNDDGEARGIGFLQFTDQQSVDNALKYHDTEYGGRYIQVRLSGDCSKGKGKQSKSQDGKSKGNQDFEVFIGGLPWATNEASLRKDFADCGEIVHLALPLTHEGKSRGLAFVEFVDKVACDKALKFNDTEYGGRRLEVRMSGDHGGHSKGKGKVGISAEKKAAKSGAMGVPEGIKRVFSDSDAE